jgi:hypothetical protein
MPLHLHGFADFANYQLPEIGSYVTGEDRSELTGLPHVTSPTAKRRPDSKSSPCSGFRK